jgi:deazaflavin-dependent oxidoreductase (nitroreductase family)
VSVSRAFARFNRRVANPVMRRVAGRLPPLAIVNHRGRITGRHYTTPVIAFTVEDGLLVGVLYGSDSDWVRNVVVAPRVAVKRRGRTLDYQGSRLVDRTEGLRLVPAGIARAYRLLGVRHFVSLTRVEE